MRETLATASFLASVALILGCEMFKSHGPIVPRQDELTALDGSENQHRAMTRDACAPVTIGACIDWMHDGGPTTYACDVDDAIRLDKQDGARRQR